MDIFDIEKMSDQEYDELCKDLKLLGKNIRKLIDDFDKKYQYRPYVGNYRAGEKPKFRDILLTVYLEKQVGITG